MTSSQHGKSWYVLVYDSLATSSEVRIKEIVVLNSNDWWHQNIDLMSVDLKRVITEELGNTIIGLHNLCLGVFVATYHYNSRIFGKHHLKVILLLLVINDPTTLAILSYRFRPWNSVRLHQKFLTLSIVIFNLHKIITIYLESLGIVRVDSNKLRPEFIDSLRIVDYVET